MSGTVNLHVGSLEQMGQRFASAWHRLEQGEVVAESHLTFLDLESMVATLSPKRIALLRHVRKHAAPNVAALARELGRDYKRVHQDVDILVRSGLLERDARGIRAPYDCVHADVSLIA